MGAVESVLKSPELSSSKVVQNSHVTLQIEQPMQQLGTFAVLLEAAGLLWQHPTYRQCLQSSKGSICEKLSTEHKPQVSVSSCSQYLDIQQFAGQNSPVKLQNLSSDPVRPAEGDRVANLQNKRMIENTVLKCNQSSVAKRSSRQRTNATKNIEDRGSRHGNDQKDRTKTVVPKKSKSKNESKKKKITSSRVPVVNVREIPNGSEDSALSSSEEGDEYAHLARRTDTTGSKDQPLNEDEEQTSNKGSGRRQRRNYKWKATKLEKAQESLQFSGSDLYVPVDESLSYPIDYFRHFFTDEIITEIANQSALYSTQMKPEKPTKVSSVDMEKFIGICLYMSLVRLSYSRNYWSSEFRVDQVADTMTLNRFEDIKRFLHFSDNSVEGSDKIKKIRPLVEKFRERYKTVPKEEHLSVNEQIVPFKGRSCLRQYNPRKPYVGLQSLGAVWGKWLRLRF